MSKTFLEFAKTNKGLIIGLLFGVLFAVLSLTIGFWATFLIYFCLSVGAVIGYNIDKNGSFTDMILNLFKSKKN